MIKKAKSREQTRKACNISYDFVLFYSISTPQELEYVLRNCMCQSMTRSPYHTLLCQVRVQNTFFVCLFYLQVINHFTKEDE